jgi:L,D-transpeptidase ErfK/SrfK
MIQPSRILFTLLFCASCLAATSQAETFQLASDSSSIIGELRETRSRHEDTLIDIAREFNLGYDQIVKANPSTNRWIPGDGSRILLPSKYLLPDAPRNGVVVNIAELRLYYFLPAQKGQLGSVVTFPVSIGRMDWKTPLGDTVVVRKDKDPAWYPPKSIKEEHARDGDPLPDMIPGGHPENPLGGFALRLGIPGYLIHGVDERKANGIGMRVTHGCMRMYPEDVARLFEIVPVKTRVTLVNQPIKVAQEGDKVYLQVVTPLHEDGKDGGDQLPLGESLTFIRSKIGADFEINEEKAARVIERGDGIPVVIGGRIGSGAASSYRTIGDEPADRGPDHVRPQRAYDYEQSGEPLTERGIPGGYGVATYDYPTSSSSDYEARSRLRTDSTERSPAPAVRRAPSVVNRYSGESGSSRQRSGSDYEREFAEDRDESYYGYRDSPGRLPSRELSSDVESAGSNSAYRYRDRNTNRPSDHSSNQPLRDSRYESTYPDGRPYGDSLDR